MHFVHNSAPSFRQDINGLGQRRWLFRLNHPQTIQDGEEVVGFDVQMWVKWIFMQMIE